MREIYNAEDIDKAQVAIRAFEIDYGAKYPKAVAKIVDDADVLLWSSTSIRLSIGCICVRRIRSKALLPQYV